MGDHIRFQPWHSAVEFKRYLHRFIKEFSRIETLAGVKRTVFNQYDLLVRPLEGWLEKHGVRFIKGCTVADLDLTHIDGKTAVSGLKLRRNGKSETVAVGADDIVIIQNASMTDASSLGSMTNAPKHLTKTESGGWVLWRSFAKIDPAFGNPAAFNASIPESYWPSFTVTLKDLAFFDQMEAFTGNKAGTGGLVTFKDLRWLMSVVLAHQPHFANQPDGVYVFWGYALHADRVGDFVAKPMSECSGREILQELCGHLNFDFDTTLQAQTASPAGCLTSPACSCRGGRETGPLRCRVARNLAFVSQFVEIPEDVVFTVEYSVRVAQMAIYQLLNIKREIPPILHHDKSLKVNFDAVIKAFQ